MPKMMCQATDPPHPPNYQDPECYYDKNGSKSCPVSLSHVESSEDHKYRASQTSMQLEANRAFSDRG